MEEAAKKPTAVEFQFIQDRNSRRLKLKKCNARQAYRDIQKLIAWIDELCHTNLQLAMAAEALLGEPQEERTEGGLVLPGQVVGAPKLIIS